MIAKLVEKTSHWQEPVTKDVKSPGAHFAAFIIYVVCMAVYFAWAVQDFLTFDPPLIYSSYETRDFKPLALDFVIDCSDCRPFFARHELGAIWELTWDYTHLPQGCAKDDSSMFSDELREFCRAQNDPASGECAKCEALQIPTPF